MRGVRVLALALASAAGRRFRGGVDMSLPWEGREALCRDSEHCAQLADGHRKQIVVVCIHCPEHAAALA